MHVSNRNTRHRDCLRLEALERLISNTRNSKNQIFETLQKLYCTLLYMILNGVNVVSYDAEVRYPHAISNPTLLYKSKPTTYRVLICHSSHKQFCFILE